MTTKPKKAVNYSPETTAACEQLLVMLLHAFGDLADGVRLIGGLVPRYLAPEAPPEVPAHVGSNDVDVVLDMAVVGAQGVPTDVVARLDAAGFSRYQNGKGGESLWQWELDIDGCWMRVDFLVNIDQPGAFAVLPVGDGSLYAAALPFAGMASSWCVERILSVELPDGGGTANATVRHADGAAFIALKALALAGRDEPKDVADIMHVMRHFPGGSVALADTFAERLRGGSYNAALSIAIAQLELHFCDDAHTEGYLKDGPRRFGSFHDFADDDERLLEQRNVSQMVAQFVDRVRRLAAPERP